jgi:phage regulator Rha-like protein
MRTASPENRPLNGSSLRRITDPTFVTLGEEVRTWKFLFGKRFKGVKERMDHIKTKRDDRVKKTELLVTTDRIEEAILLVRGHKVLVDADLAALYGVETRSLVQAVKRNIQRFPSDFMFQLNQDEFAALRSQIVISKGKGGRRYLPYVFTEQGVAMLSSVLNSERAIQVNIAVMRVFVRLREFVATHKELAAKLKELEERIQDHDVKIVTIFDAIRQLMAPPDRPKKRIGFEVKEPKTSYGKKASA